MASAAARPASAAAGSDVPVLRGPILLVAGLVLALSNFMVVLDTAIANVSVPHIAGSLAISPDQGTWVITSYSVAEAICVPLTGWLAQRFGTVRSFTYAMIGFAFFSAMCGFSRSLTMLVAMRIGQGFCGGPLMPLTQTLLLRVFPPEKRAQSMALWAMTTVIAPIAGPILGGYISDNWSWPWIFFINLPFAALCLFGVFRLLRQFETPTQRRTIDGVGLGLLVVWIGALQIMLDIGRDHDWFASTYVWTLAIIAAIGCAVFLAWEMTDPNPVVDLRVLRHRGFTFAIIALAMSFGTYFATVVVIPQWLQGSLGYTATESGFVTAFSGVLAVVMSPVAARMMAFVDARALTCFGILWLGLTSYMRSHWTAGADFWTLALPQLVQGFGVPFFFVPLTTIALGSVNPEETASAAGLMSFLRTLAGAIGASIMTTQWNNSSRFVRAQLVGTLNGTDTTMQALQGAGFSADQARGQIAAMVDTQALAVATTHVFFIGTILFCIAAAMIWVVPKPPPKVDTSAAH